MSRNQNGVFSCLQQLVKTFGVLVPLTILLICFAPLSSHSQEYSQSEAVEDLSFLKDAMITYNPGLSRFNPDFDKKMDSLLSSVQGDLDIYQYFTKVSQLCALSNEGHFNVGGWEDTVHQGFLKNRYSYFPFSIKMVDRRVFIWDNYSNDTSLKRGDEIISINGNGIAGIVGRMYKCISSDGNIENNRRVRLQSGFPWMYYLFEEQAEVFEMGVLKFPHHEETNVAVEALTRKEMGHNFSSRNDNIKTEKSEEKEALYDLSFRDSVAFLTLKTFDWQVVESGNYDAKELYEKLFAQIREKGTKVLVVDLRYNTGGRNEFAMEMIPYILKIDDKGAVYKTSISWKGKSKTYKLPKKSKLAFDGKIYTLTNGWTYSAGASLARYLAEYGSAYSVGSETGSRYEGFVAGSKQAVYLPHSGIKIGIPRYAYVFPKSEKEMPANRGLIPDFPTQPTVTTYMDEVDLEMQKVIELIKDCATCHF